MTFCSSSKVAVFSLWTIYVDLFLNMSEDLNQIYCRRSLDMNPRLFRNGSLEDKVKERTAELEKAYNSLKESEERLAEAQKIAHIGSWECNPVTNKLYWSDEVYRIFELDPQEFEQIHDAFFKYVHPEDREYVNHAIKEALNGKQYNIDYRIILANGVERIVYVQGGAIFDEK